VTTDVASELRVGVDTARPWMTTWRPVADRVELLDGLLPRLLVRAVPAAVRVVADWTPRQRRAQTRALAAILTASTTTAASPLASLGERTPGEVCEALVFALAVLAHRPCGVSFGGITFTANGVVHGAWSHPAVCLPQQRGTAGVPRTAVASVAEQLLATSTSPMGSFMDDNRTAVVLIPPRIGLDLLGAIGGLLDAALDGAVLVPGNGTDVAARVVLREDQTRADATRRLNAAQRRISRTPLTPGPEDEPAEEPDPDNPMTLNHLREHPDGGGEFGLGGADQVARALAQHLLEAFIPAMNEAGAVNYLSWDAIDSVSGGRYSLIVVKPDGLTPHEARQAAEEECRRLRALLDEHGIDPAEVIG
jgi:hypothetical protein